MPTTPLTPSQYLLYSASALAIASVIGHTQMAYELVFPSLRRISSVTTPSTTATAAGDRTSKTQVKKKGYRGGDGDDDGVVAAGIGWMEGNQVFAVLAILYAKWAKYGITDGFDRAILVLTVGYQFGCGVAFARKGIYKPLVALWLGPGLATLSQLV